MILFQSPSLSKARSKCLKILRYHFYKILGNFICNSESGLLLSKTNFCGCHVFKLDLHRVCMLLLTFKKASKTQSECVSANEAEILCLEQGIICF